MPITLRGVGQGPCPGSRLIAVVPRAFSRVSRPASGRRPRQQTFRVSPTLRRNLPSPRPTRLPYESSACRANVCFLTSSFVLLSSGRLTGRGAPPPCAQFRLPRPSIRYTLTKKTPNPAGRLVLAPPALCHPIRGLPCRDVTLACGLCPPSFSRPCFTPPHSML